ncbi:ATP-binding protein [Metapseudomonas otitidis]|uniref:ATP-binding protein n=1 Tax=Metapseudomonas otitidis TaxID=319939 RepID=UPI00244A4653|nr:ATP-binding protein [Pseudomonas otitidis]MDH0336810.1 putative DNA binding domain-containing protein [Pseudomonas otitidis]
MSGIAVVDRAKTAIELGESHFREFKSALEGPPGEKKKRAPKEIATNIAQTLVAFANADGGELLVGVEDNGEISGLVGFSEKDYEILESAPKVRVHESTPLTSVRKRRINIDGKEILYFSVPKSVDYIHITSDGRCLQRRDLESVPVSSEAIQFDRREKRSREYDRIFIDGVSAEDLDLDLVRTVADQVLKGMSAEKCLQYLELGEYGLSQLRLRRASLLLFAKDPQKWHPRLQIRILKVDGQEVKTGEDYNIVHDEIVKGNILKLINSAWEALRPYLVQTKIDKHARFEQSSIYPELACREALLNSIAHRDYSDEGRGIEVYIFDDHLEIRNPGALLSSMRIEDIISQKGVHQSRNTHISRVLRELGYMRELGEGMRRIYDLMQKNELASPELISNHDSFSITLTNKAMYSSQDLLWLSQFEEFELDRQMKSVILLGQNGRIFSAANIWEAVGIVDTEDYRKLVDSLLTYGILINAVERFAAKRAARKAKIPFKEYPRYKIIIPEISNLPTISEEKSGKASHTEKESHTTTKPNFLENIEKNTQLEKPREETARIFVANLPLDAENEALYDLFDKYGSIRELRIPRYAKGKCKGYAFVSFEESDAVENLIGLNGTITYLDRKLVIQRALPKPTKN